MSATYLRPPCGTRARQPLLLRRTKQTRLADGTPIVQLPPRKVHIEWLLFTPEERDFYDALRTQSKVKFDAFVAEGRVLNNYAHVLAMLLQMRQACDHPHLVLSRADTDTDLGRIGKQLLRRWREMKEARSLPDPSDLVDHTSASSITSISDRSAQAAGEAADADGVHAQSRYLEDTLQQLKRQASAPPAKEDKENAPSEEAAEGAEAAARGGGNADSAGGKAGGVARGAAGGAAAGRADEAGNECVVCLDSFDDAVLTGCAHQFCRECILGCIGNMSAAPCPICRPPPQVERAWPPALTPWLGLAWLWRGARAAASAHRWKGASLEALPHPLSPPLTFSDPPRLPVSKNDIITVPRASRFSVDLDKHWRNSSKIDALMADLHATLAAPLPPPMDPPAAPATAAGASSSADAAGSSAGAGVGAAKAAPAAVAKACIFSQWTAMLDLVERPLRAAGLRFVRLDGSMALPQREAALHTFASDKTTRVMLLSLKTGGVGLNLVSAQTVYLLDPWWNPAVEEQAVNRIHRIGQRYPVRVKHFMMSESVEVRIHELQKKKAALVKGAIGGVSKEDAKGMRVDELRLLFS